MALMNLIEFVDEDGGEMAHRIPEQGSGEFKVGSQLIVRESQWAVFFRDGKAYDVFGAGRHTLATGRRVKPPPLFGSRLSFAADHFAFRKAAARYHS